MRKLILILIFIVLSVSAYAQTLSVESFKLLESDLTANTTGTQVRDQNGQVAALIKVVTSETGFVFDGGMMGVVKTIQKTGEIWVYVPAGIQKITIQHQQLGILRDYYFPISIEKARTYELKLISGVVRTIVEEQIAAQYVTLTVEPKNASVSIDDIPYQLDVDGSVSQLLSYGTHNYHVEAPGYSPENGIIRVSGEQLEVKVALQSSMATVTIECSMPQAGIYLNNVLVGHGTWTGQRTPGLYQVETRLEGHRSRTTSFTLEARDTKTITAPAPQPIYGSLSISSTPGKAVIFLDGKEIGQTPLLVGDILIGKHEIEIIRKDYRPYKTSVTVEESKMESINATLSDIVQASIYSVPQGASLSIGGTKLGNTPVYREMTSGDYDMRLELSGYEPFHRTVHVDAANPDVTIYLQKRMLSKNQFYTDCSYQLLGASPFIVHTGLYFCNINVELGMSLPAVNDYDVYWLTDPDANSTSSRYLHYKYHYKYGMSAALGYGIRPINSIRITPQVGVCNTIITTIQGEKQQTSVLSAMGSLRLEYSFVRHLAIVVQPTYYKSVYMGAIAEQLDQYTPLIKDWCPNLTVNIGLELYF